jgi:N-acetylmuramic acid 6-phosphate (MurNAc-6-P) etherase/phosphoglycolate phosphatase-like HAD superfamily hydrolase
MLKNLNLRITAMGLVFTFLANMIGPCPLSQAQEFVLPAPGTMVSLSQVSNPPILKGLKVHPDNPFRFDFILDKGDSNVIPAKAVIQRLIKYFLASLTIPESDLWVNLSPYEKNRIVPESFGQTEMGRDLLAEDYILKQITASLIYPEGETGKKFWKRVYEEAAKKFGTANIPVNTFNKVWIVPDKAVVYENAHAGTAYVVEAKLKVMLEQDYLSMSKHQSQPGDMSRRDVSPSRFPSNGVLNVKATQVSNLSTNVIREIVIPELNKEVNFGQNFAQLRQVYNSLILATWYKNKIKDSILEQVYADKNKVDGIVSSQGNEAPETIYQRYLRAFKKGVYNFIKDEIDPRTQQSIPRKYFSGGIIMDLAMHTGNVVQYTQVIPATDGSDKAIVVETELQQAQMTKAPFFEDLKKAIANAIPPKGSIASKVYNDAAMVIQPSTLLKLSKGEVVEVDQREAQAYFSHIWALPDRTNQIVAGIIRMNSQGKVLFTIANNQQEGHIHLVHRAHDTEGYAVPGRWRGVRPEYEWIILSIGRDKDGKITNLDILPPTISIPHDDYSDKMLEFFGKQRSEFPFPGYLREIHHEIVRIARVFAAAVNDPENVTVLIDRNTFPEFRDIKQVNLKMLADAAMAYEFKSAEAKKFYETDWPEFKLTETTTEQGHSLTQNLSLVMNQRSVEEGLGLLSAVDDSVVDGFKEFSKEYLMALSEEIYIKLHNSQGRVIFVGAGSSGRMAVELAKKWDMAEPEMKGRVVGVIAGGPRALVRAREGFEDSEQEGRNAIIAQKVSRDDTVFLISASGSATFNVGAAKQARVRGASTYYFYNSQSIPRRTDDLFKKNGVKRLLIDTGPQAITGSTRLQAASLAILSLGSLLEVVLMRDKKGFQMDDYIQKMERNLQSALKSIRAGFVSIKGISDLGVEVFSDPEANFRKLKDETQKGYITAIASPHAIGEALVDMTETAPTFSTNPPRTIPELEKGLKQAELQAFLVGADTNLEAWETLVGQKAITEQEKEGVLEIPIGGVEGERESFLEIRHVGQGNLVVAVLKDKDLDEFNGSDLESSLREAKKQGAKTAMIVVSHRDLSNNQSLMDFMDREVDAHVILDNIPHDSLGITETLALKMALNLISNSIMVRMGKVLGNKMIDVNASNKKLIARSVRLVQEILTRYKTPVEFLRDDYVLDHVMRVQSRKRELEVRGIYTPSVVKITAVMINRKFGFENAFDLLRENNEKLEGILITNDEGMGGGEVEVIKPIQESIKAIVFDWDGVIQQAVDLIHEAEIPFLIKFIYGDQPTEDQKKVVIDYKKTNAGNVRVQYEWAIEQMNPERRKKLFSSDEEGFKLYKTQFTEMVIGAYKKIEDHWQVEVPLFGDIERLLQNLKQSKSDVHMDVATNLVQEAHEYRAQMTGFGHYFEEQYGSENDKLNLNEDVKLGALERAYGAINDGTIKKEQVAIFEDNASNIKSAVENGFTAVGVARDIAHARALRDAGANIIIYGDYRNSSTIMEVLKIPKNHAMAVGQGDAAMRPVSAFCEALLKNKRSFSLHLSDGRDLPLEVDFSRYHYSNWGEDIYSQPQYLIRVYLFSRALKDNEGERSQKLKEFPDLAPLYHDVTLMDHNIPPSGAIGQMSFILVDESQPELIFDENQGSYGFWHLKNSSKKKYSVWIEVVQNQIISLALNSGIEHIYARNGHQVRNLTSGNRRFRFGYVYPYVDKPHWLPATIDMRPVFKYAYPSPSHFEEGWEYVKNPPNAAMNTRGGIDLTSDKALAVQNNGRAIRFHVDPALLAQLRDAPGFTPVIINIQPMTNLRVWLR